MFDIMDRILKQPMVERDALLQSIRGEIEQAVGQDRYRLLLDRDLRYLLDYESTLVANSNSCRLWFTTPGIMSERLTFLDTYRELRRSRLQDLTPERAGNDLVVRVLGTEEPAWMSWRTMARIELQRRDELTRRLASF